MPTGFYRFSVGDFRCVALHDGSMASPVEQYAQRFPTVSLGDVQEVLHEIGHTGDVFRNSYNCLFVENGDMRLLVDTGFGAGHTASSEVGLMVQHMQSAGIQPADVNLVFISHFHGDHISGLMTKDGQRVFPNARYVASQTEWDFWLADDRQEQSPRTEVIDQKLRPLAGDFSFVRDSDEVAPGIRAVAVPGHTPGQTGLLLESGGARMMYLADLLAGLPQLLHPDWHFRFDSDSAQAVQTRQTILARLADERLLAMFYHLPFPGLGTVARQGDGYRWQPVD